MKKIASPQDLQAELRRLLAYSQGPEKPSRDKIAAELRVLANRVANLPDWPGADHVYSYLYKVLEQLGAENWKAEVERAKKRRVKPKPPRPTSDMETIMDALGKGDEEQLKALQMKYKLR